MARLTFLKLAEKILAEQNIPLTALQIWEIANEKGYNAELRSQGKTPWKTIEAQIYVNLRDDQNSIFTKVNSKPVKFFLKELAEKSCEQVKNEDKVDIQNAIRLPYRERQLHPFLSYYAYTYMHIFTKTILHEKSDKKRFTQWLHPDIVGVYFPIDDWQEEVLDFSRAIGQSNIKLYSFELKRELNFQNLRESFFQAVSNSSWANEGYLVAAEIDQNEEFQIELKRLCISFGIGVLKLEIEDPDSSAILYPARYKNQMDWENINKLAEENPDFKEFTKRIKIDLTSKEIRKEGYDKVYNDPDDLRSIICLQE